jgi:hypothetical protein
LKFFINEKKQELPPNDIWDELNEKAKWHNT